MSTIFNSDQRRRFESDVKFFDSIGVSYEDSYGKNIGLLKFLPKAISVFPAESKVLDVGCGTGTPIASMIASAGHQVAGIDISPSMIELSRKAVPEGQFYVANMLEFVPRDQPINAVLAIFSLFFMSREEIGMMCRKWSEWLAADGVLCIATVAADSLDPAVGHYDDGHLDARCVPFRFMGQNSEITLLTKDCWSTVLERVGFEVVHTEEYWFVPPAEADSDSEMEYFIIARKMS